MDCRLKDNAPRIVISGATGGFARTLIAQISSLESIKLVAFIDIAEAAARELASGVETSSIHEIALYRDVSSVDWSELDVLVEATGNVEAGTNFAKVAIENGCHVVMASKEVESVSGVYLSRLADSRGVSYKPAGGDQPANLISLFEYATQLELELAFLGKSGEYDVIYNLETATAEYLDGHLGGLDLGKLLDPSLGILELVRRRGRVLADFERSGAADYCEMQVVSMYTGIETTGSQLLYPILRLSELADFYEAYIEENTGINQPRLDVFSTLRQSDEISAAGGVFAVFRTPDEPTAELLRAKGHIVSASGRYACFLLPYHWMGLETVRTIKEVFNPEGSHVGPRFVHTLAAVASYDIPAGHHFVIEGHHHDIEMLRPEFREYPSNDGAAPFYLLGGCRTKRLVHAGEVIKFSDVDMPESLARSAYLKGNYEC